MGEIQGKNNQNRIDMEMNGIDLTKCRNERARIRYRHWYDESSVYDATGYIEQVKDRWVHLVDDEDGGFIPLWYDGKIDENIMEFEIIPRDPETYKDWRVGDKVICSDEKWNDSAYKEIIFRSGELVICKDGNGDISGGYTCGQLHRLGYRLVLTDIEKRVIEERKKSEWEPQDGDIVAWKDEEDNGPDAVSIYKGKDRGYATMLTNGDIIYSPYATFAMNIIRPATDEEKQRLFDAMAKEGKRWNAEKKVVEDIPKPYEFRKGEPVLARNENNGTWHITTFIESKSGCGRPFYADNGMGRVGYYFCIPYNERTMHLLGTSNDYVEE